MFDIKKQLWENQIWETVAFAAKAGFLFLLTPLMLKVWGREGYGEFAIASSTVVFASVLDFGIRGRARVGLCEAIRLDDEAMANRILSRATASFLLIGLVAILGVCLLASLHFWSRALGFPSALEWLIPKTIAIALGVTISGIWLEPLVARGQIGKLKLAVAIGSALAIPAVCFSVRSGSPVSTAVLLWQGSLLLTNLAFAYQLRTVSLSHLLQKITVSDFYETVRDGVWFNLTTITWLTRTHGLTLIVSSIEGIATAGLFFILVRMAEIISGLGAISCDVLLGALPAAKNNRQQIKVFRQSIFFAMVLALPAAIFLVIFMPMFWNAWLHTNPPFGYQTGWLVAAIGLTSAFNRIMTYAALGLNLGKFAGMAGLLETVTTMIIFALLLSLIGLCATIFMSVLTSIFVVFLAYKIYKTLKIPFGGHAFA